MVSVMVVEDRFGTGSAVAAWLEGAGATVEKSTNYAEAMGTISYRQLAGGELPGVVVGPLAKDGIAFLADLRGQGAEVPVAFYSLTPSRDLDGNLMRQHGLVGVLHQPFANEDPAPLFAAVGKPPPTPATVTAPTSVSSSGTFSVPPGVTAPRPPAPAPAAPPPPPPVAADPPGRATALLPVIEMPARLPPAPAAAPPPLPTLATPTTTDLPPMPGDRRRMEAEEGPAARDESRTGLKTVDVDAKRGEAKGEKDDKEKDKDDKEGSATDTASGVQRLLVDPMMEQVKKEAERVKKPPVERDISMIAVDDRFNTAHLLVERLGGPGQFMKNVPSYREAYLNLDRRVLSRSNADLVVGPLSAEGVTFIKDIRKRGWATAVVFYTESQAQSQDPKLPGQYGCLAIVRRLAMLEPLEKIIHDIRHSPIPAPPPPMPTRDSASSNSRPSSVTGAVGTTSSAATATGSTRKVESDPPTSTRHRSELKSGEHRAVDPKVADTKISHDGKADEPEIHLEPRVAKDVPATTPAPLRVDVPPRPAAISTGHAVGPSGNARMTPRPGSLGEGPVPTTRPASLADGAVPGRPASLGGDSTLHPAARNGDTSTTAASGGSATGTTSSGRAPSQLPRRTPSGVFTPDETFLTPADADKRGAGFSRVRRSLGPGSSDRLEVVGTEGDGSGSTSTGGSLTRERLLTCARCKQDFFAAVRASTQAVLCTHCGATNTVEPPKT
jgi:CheY-like chemotaxis protein